MRPPVARPVRKSRLILGVFCCALAASVAVGFVWLAVKTGEGMADQKTAQQEAIEQARGKAYPISAADLSDAYKANEVDADQRYKRRMLKVTGVVSKVAKDILDNPYVVVGSGEPFQFVGVQCYFPGDQIGTLTNIRPGDTVTVTGLCEGKMMNVRLTDCRVER